MLRKLLVVGSFVGSQAWFGGSTEKEPTVADQFDPQEAVRALMDETRQAKAALERESAEIDEKLNSVVGKTSKPKAAMLQVKSKATLESEQRAFEKRRAALIERNARELAEKKDRFNEALARLRRDSASMLVKKTGPSSFLEVGKGAPANVKPVEVEKFFAESKALVDRVHKVVEGLKVVEAIKETKEKLAKTAPK